MNKNIPAFPNKGDNTPGYEIYDGMTLRDYFAGQALAGILARSGHVLCIAKQSYEIADAMLAEREGG